MSRGNAAVRSRVLSGKIRTTACFMLSRSTAPPKKEKLEATPSSNASAVSAG
jgi:hypothetical protein